MNDGHDWMTQFLGLCSDCTHAPEKTTYDSHGHENVSQEQYTFGDWGHPFF